MKCAGLDIGSRTVKLAVLEGGELVLSRKTVTSHNPLESARALMKDAEFDRITATGYGRHLIRGHLECPVVSEIKAFAVGARFLAPECRSILDIGGQDTKAISLDEEGTMSKFEMNDKCAAGTGRFFESMIRAFEVDFEEFSNMSLRAKQIVRITSQCSVFAESEVVSLVAQKKDPADIAAGIQAAVAKRCFTMLKSAGVEREVTMTGGCAKNLGLKKALEKVLRFDIVQLATDPQLMGSIGAAEFARRKVLAKRSVA